MQFRVKGTCALIASVAAVGVMAGPAAAAPVTISTDAGTTCTLDADAKVGRGLIVKPIDFVGDVSCSLADPANPAVVSAALLLQNEGLPLGIGEKSGKPNNNQDTQRIPVEEGFVYSCELSPDADCGFNGRQPLGLSGQTYTALFGAGFTPPEGETWVAFPEDCTLDSGDEGGIACSSTDRVKVR